MALLPAAGGIVLGLVFIGTGIYMYRREVQALQHAEPVAATITSSSVYDETRRDPDGGTDRTWYPEIHYEYRVEGRTYTDSQLLPAQERTGGNRGYAQELVEQYPEGADVTAYYNPEQPDQAFLIKKRTKMPYILVASGILAIGVGAAFLL